MAAVGRRRFWAPKMNPMRKPKMSTGLSFSQVRTIGIYYIHLLYTRHLLYVITDVTRKRLITGRRNRNLRLSPVFAHPSPFLPLQPTASNIFVFIGANFLINSRDARSSAVNKIALFIDGEKINKRAFVAKFFVSFQLRTVTDGFWRC